MADRLVVDLGADGQAAVSWAPTAGLAEELSRSALAWPLDSDVLEDLRWYLEDYLLAPFGVWEERGPAVAERLAGWGELVFGSVFGSGPARDRYQRARNRGPEVVFRSAEPRLLALPWELMRDGSGAVALGVGGISRSLPVADSTETLEVSGGKLRVLMVISRPAGTRDVSYQMVARPLLERLDAVRGEVELTVLRPPTFDNLRQAVKQAADADNPFHVVHFDGHGAMPGGSGGGTPGGRPAMMAGTGEGVLAFEKPGGGSDLVGASKVAAVLAEGRVPVAVLNACQSGAVGKDLEASVATALLKAGCAAVVAMAYSVYAVAAAEFMAAFYESLFAGHSVGQAVTAGRKRLFRHDGRPSPKGEMPLADWLVPVHYMRAEVRFPDARTSRSVEAPPLDEALDQIRSAPDTDEAAVGDSLAAVGSFVGRDDLFFQLEAAARLQRVVVLTGPGGAGKTELAKGFARWWRDTGGIDDPRLAFWHSFEPGVASFGLDGVITALGLQVFGADFARLERAQRLDAVKQLLGQYRGLLVWDNFESVAEMPDPDGATPPLDEADRTALREFLDWVRDHSKSTVIITSRAREDWLGQVPRIEVGGLNRAEAAEYAGYLLAPFPAAQQRRARRSFGELLEWLDGHPLAMRLTLPRLEATDPANLLAGLQGTSPLTGGDDTTPGRLSSLGACITYSFTHLTGQARRLLPAVSLLHGVADQILLTALSAAETVPARFAGISGQEWTAVLQDAARVGLLTDIGADTYGIHPALPSYLAAGWHADNPDGFGQERDSCEQALRTACAALSQWLTAEIHSGGAELAYALIGLHRRTLGAMLGHALDHHAWDDADDIVRALDVYWDARGLSEEAATWADRILSATSEPSQGQLKAARGLWLYTTIQQANRQADAGQPDQAAQTYRDAIAYLQAQPATNWTRESVAVIYHQLGLTAQESARLDEAEDWYRKSLAIKEELGNRPGMARSYHQLGNTAYLRRRLEEAEDWYRKALTIKEEIGDRPSLAFTYHQLGITAQDRRRLDEADDWYRQAIQIRQKLGLRVLLASDYHQLGNTAQLRGRLDEAEDWYRKSLAISEELVDRRGMAITYAQLGLLAEERDEAAQALTWTIRCVALFTDFPSPLTGSGPSALVRLTRRLGMPALEQTWQEITGQPLPKQVRDYIISQPDEERS